MKHRAVVRSIGVDVSEDGSNTPAVVLEVCDGLLPVVTALNQTQAIQLGLSDGQFERSLTHDPPVEMVTEFGEAIDSIHIDNLSNGTFLAKTDARHYHDGEARSVVFDARLSGAIILAIRVGCPILISNEVLDAAGQSPEAFDANLDEWPGAVAAAPHDFKPLRRDPARMSEPTATLDESRIKMTELLLPNDTNSLGRALGGTILYWMDTCGTITAMHFSDRQCVTTSIDHVNFVDPIDLDEAVIMEAYVFNISRTSVDVKVDMHTGNPRIDR